MAKRRDLEGFRQSLGHFDLPPAWHDPIVKILPWLEIALALALIPLLSARVAAAAILATLAAFQWVLVNHLSQGLRPHCHCFGASDSQPIGWATVARNGALMLASLILLHHGPGPWTLNRPQSAWEVTTLVLLALLGMRQLQLQTRLEKLELQQLARPNPPESRSRPEVKPLAAGLTVGTPAPLFSLETLAGERVTLAHFLDQGRWVVLHFISTQCGSCRSLLPLIRRWDQDYAEKLTQLVVCQGDLDEVRLRIAAYQPRHLLLQGDSLLAQRYEAHWTPASLAIDPQGIIQSPLQAGLKQIRSLVDHTLVRANQASGLPPLEVFLGDSPFQVGEPAPNFRLARLDGVETHLYQLLERPATLLLFLDPNCPHCGRLVGLLIDWEVRRSLQATALLLVSSGDPTQVRPLTVGLKSQVFCDPDFQIGPLLGISQVPAGLRLDSQGRITSGLALGADAILPLLEA